MSTYVIKDSLHGGYYTGMSAIGPMMGGTVEEASQFGYQSTAAMEAGFFPMQVLWEIEEIIED